MQLQPYLKKGNPDSCPSCTCFFCTTAKMKPEITKSLFIFSLLNVGNAFSFSQPTGICSFNADSYTGGWYEIATSDYVSMTTEAGCKCSAAYYTTNPNDTNVLDVTNSCIRNGRFWSVTGQVHSAPAGQPQGNLHVSLDGYPTRTNGTNYHILKLYGGTEEPQQAVVGGSDENHWWLLSRNPNWNDTIWYNVVHVLEASEYNITGFRVPEQTCQFLGSHGRNLIPPPSVRK